MSHSFLGGKWSPQAERLEITPKNSKLKIGIPCETEFQENRVALTPDAVHILVSNGHEVLIETNAGVGSGFDDSQYSEYGAQIAYNTQEVFQQPLVIKVTPPSIQEIEFMSMKSHLISTLQLNTRNKAYFEKLNSKKITAIAYDFIKDDGGYFPVVRALSEIAGKTAILTAAELLSNKNIGLAKMLGNTPGVPPTEIVVIGAGNVGESAVKTAIGLGASVKLFDQSMARIRRLTTRLQTPIFSSVLVKNELEKALQSADILIGAVGGYGRTPIVVSETMIGKMKEGAIVIDISIDSGGCIETSEITSHDSPYFIKHGVIHYAVPNITSKVAFTATTTLSNFFLPYLIKMGEYGGIEEMIKMDPGFRNGVYQYKGMVTKKPVADWFDLEFKNLELFFI